MRNPPFRSPVIDDKMPALELNTTDVDHHYASFIQIVDLLGRVHQLHRQPFNFANEEDVQLFLTRSSVSSLASQQYWLMAHRRSRRNWMHAFVHGTRNFRWRSERSRPRPMVGPWRFLSTHSSTLLS